MTPRTQMERIIGTDKYRLTIDRIQFVLSLAEFQQLSQQVLDKIQALVVEQQSQR